MTFQIFRQFGNTDSSYILLINSVKPGTNTSNFPKFEIALYCLMSKDPQIKREKRSGDISSKQVCECPMSDQTWSNSWGSASQFFFAQIDHDS